MINNLYIYIYINSVRSHQTGLVHILIDQTIAKADDFLVSTDLVSDLLNLGMQNIEAIHLLIKTACKLQILEIFI
jgi:hypothetical protein